MNGVLTTVCKYRGSELLIAAWVAAFFVFQVQPSMQHRIDAGNDTARVESALATSGMSESDIHNMTTDASTTHYDVHAKTGRQLLAELLVKGPEKNGRQFWAQTDWNVSWKYWYRAGSKSCEIQSSSIKLKIKFIYPKWVDEDLAPSALAVNWQKSMGALVAHEEEHASHGRNAAEEIRSLMQQNLTADTCEALGERLNRQGAEIIERHAAQDRSLDRITNHGATTIPPIQSP